jgi:hypothetical protein
MEVLEEVRDTPIVIFETRTEFEKLKTTTSRYWRPAFNCPQCSAFEYGLAEFARHRFIIISVVDSDRQSNIHITGGVTSAVGGRSRRKKYKDNRMPDRGELAKGRTKKATVSGSCTSTKRDIMRKLFIMKIPVGEFLVLLRWYRKYLNDIGKDTSPGEND